MDFVDFVSGVLMQLCACVFSQPIALYPKEVSHYCVYVLYLCVQHALCTHVCVVVVSAGCV